MNIFHNHLHFSLFKNKELDALYLNIALVGFANALISVFVPLFLWDLGYPLWQIVVFYLLLAVYYVFLMVVLLPILRGLSDKMMIFLSVPLLILYYLGLEYLADYRMLFYLTPIAYSFHAVLFNLGFHICFTTSADDGKVGQEVGARYMIQVISQLLGPVLGGVLITAFGFENTFLVGSVILLFSVIPLFFFPKRNASPHIDLRGIKKYLTAPELRGYNISGVGFAVEKRINEIIWAVFIFLSVGSLEKFGFVISAGLLLGGVLTYLVGLMGDQGKRRKLLKFTSLGLGLMWFIRPFLINTTGVVTSHLGRRAFFDTTRVSWSSQFYKISRKVEHTTLFILSREFIYNFSRIIVLSVLAGLAYVLPLAVFFKVSFIIAGLFALLYLFANKQKHTRELNI